MEIPAIKKIKPIMARAQGLTIKAILPKIPNIPNTRDIAPPINMINARILIISLGVG